MHKFWKTYQEKLEEAVKQFPEDYPPGADPKEYAAKVAGRFSQLDFSEVNHEGRGFRRTCAALGIKQTRKAIAAYLGADHG